MLTELRVRGVGVIDDVTIQLADGLTVVTGETGVGKTLIVTGLSLLCGARGDAQLRRDDADSSVIEALVRNERGEAAVSRQLGRSGNRIRIDGSIGTVSDLRAWAERRIAIHGQHAHLRLAEPRVQRSLIDQFAGPAHLANLERHRMLFDERAAAIDERDARSADERARLRMAEQLRHEQTEIEAAGIDLDADGRLADRLAAAENGEQVQQALAQAAAALGEDGAGDSLGVAIASLRSLPVAPGLDELVERTIGAAEEVTALSRDLRDAAEAADIDAAQLEELRERARTLDGLRRKYGDDLEAVVAHADEARQRLAELSRHDERVGQLDDLIVEIDAKLATASATLEQGRRDAIDRLSAAVTTRLGPLGLPHAEFIVHLEAGGTARDGGHEVTFAVAVNPGAPAVTLRKGASGGERSRISLAIETALADADETTTLVFDEVDAGIGGETAMAVGAALAELAHARPDRQVLCVTHLAQVAAHADIHHVVTKQVVEGRTVTTTRRLDATERPGELARMMSGVDSASAAALADELLELAAVHRRPGVTA